MIGHIRGAALVAEGSALIVDVGGVGYELTVGESVALTLMASAESTVSLFVHTQVSQDKIELFGFTHLAHKKVFLKLLQVSGIGPKIALQAVTEFSLAELAHSIANSDEKAISKIKGVGPKAARRIIADLKDVQAWLPANIDVVPIASLSTPMQQAHAALVHLGCSSQEAETLLRGVESPSEQVGELVKQALQVRAKK